MINYKIVEGVMLNEDGALQSERLSKEIIQFHSPPALENSTGRSPEHVSALQKRRDLFKNQQLNSADLSY
jgi:hypothetical protein